jgi:hypothetical protein
MLGVEMRALMFVMMAVALGECAVPRAEARTFGDNDVWMIVQVTKPDTNGLRHKTLPTLPNAKPFSGVRQK